MVLGCITISLLKLAMRIEHVFKISFVTVLYQFEHIESDMLGENIISNNFLNRKPSFTFVNRVMRFSLFISAHLSL